MTEKAERNDDKTHPFVGQFSESERESDTDIYYDVMINGIVLVCLVVCFLNFVCGILYSSGLFIYGLIPES